MTSPKILVVFAFEAVAAAALPAEPVRAATTPDTLVLGRDLNGDPCAAGITYNDPQISPYDRAFVITCRSVSAGRWQGQAMVFSARYTHPKYNGWNQVRNLSASATSAKFSIDAKPAMAFKMDLEKSRNGLAGTLKVAGTQTPPTDPLVVPFELKRVP